MTTQKLPKLIKVRAIPGKPRYSLTGLTVIQAGTGKTSPILDGPVCRTQLATALGWNTLANKLNGDAE